ncbi:hypothetical protein NM688_g3158 [Phlebia brevispora]|uniref:Uncharacterized protein n=1 Tax=Phlebia brevispora TaxID=194682 RepID=A0ACC1T6G8_9APHY|nr:hypothetical protein NM688_g3158 [Phlebia brevispora]
MNDYKRLTCRCALSLCLEVQQSPPEDVLNEVYASPEEGLYRDLWGVSTRLYERMVEARDKHFPVELIIIPCSKHPDQTIEYQTVFIDLTKIETKLEYKLPSAQFDDKFEQSIRLFTIARLRHLRFVCSNRLSDLAAANTYLRSCIGSVSLDECHRSLFEAEMGVYLHARFHLLGDSAFLEAAIEKMDSAVELARKSIHTQTVPFFLRELGMLMFCKYRNTQDMDQLEMAITHLKDSAALASATDIRALASASRLLIDTLLVRYQRSQCKDDLDAAIRQHESIGNAVQCRVVPAQSMVLVENTTTLACCEWLKLYSTLLYMRFMNSHRTEDLQLAIMIAELLVAQPPAEWSSHLRGSVITCLVNCLIERFRVGGRVEDINRVAELVSYNPEGSVGGNLVNAPEHAYQMGKLMTTAFEWFKRKKDIDSAVAQLFISVFQAETMKFGGRDIQSMYRVHMEMADIAFVRRTILVSPRLQTISFTSVKDELRLHLRSGRLLHDWSEYSLRLHDLARAKTIRGGDRVEQSHRVVSGEQ